MCQATEAEAKQCWPNIAAGKDFLRGKDKNSGIVKVAWKNKGNDWGYVVQVDNTNRDPINNGGTEIGEPWKILGVRLHG